MCLDVCVCVCVWVRAVFTLDTLTVCTPAAQRSRGATERHVACLRKKRRKKEEEEEKTEKREEVLKGRHAREDFWSEYEKTPFLFFFPPSSSTFSSSLTFLGLHLISTVSPSIIRGHSSLCTFCSSGILYFGHLGRLLGCRSSCSFLTKTRVSYFCKIFSQFDSNQIMSSVPFSVQRRYLSRNVSPVTQVYLRLIFCLNVLCETQTLDLSWFPFSFVFAPFIQRMALCWLGPHCRLLYFLSLHSVRFKDFTLGNSFTAGFSFPRSECGPHRSLCLLTGWWGGGEKWRKEKQRESCCWCFNTYRALYVIRDHG